MKLLLGRIGSNRLSLILPAFCAAILVWTAVVPVVRAFRLLEIGYNEGWNAYTALRLAAHQPLYPAPYGWTYVNYPALSFHLIAALGESPSGYLFAARMSSLAGLCLSGALAALIVWHMTRSRAAAWLAGAFLLALFCANADTYVGMDDPQMLAQALSLAGLYIYVRSNRGAAGLGVCALLFVLSGNIKHNLIEFPLAVLVDLAMSKPRRALRFAGAIALMTAISVVVTSHVDGASYLSCLLSPRSYSVYAGAIKLRDWLGPIVLPLLAAVWMVRPCLKTSRRRVLALLLICALVVDAVFCGGQGVAINGVFGVMVATALLTGVFWARLPRLSLGNIAALPRPIVCAGLFLWLAIPMILSGNWRTDKALAQSRDQERRFASEVVYLRQQNGPALCESLLRCYYAGKPYRYDPFNASRFIEQGKLDPGVMVNALHDRKFAAIQLDESASSELNDPWAYERFQPPILEAILENYRPAYSNQDGVIYLPRSAARPTSAPPPTRLKPAAFKLQNRARRSLPPCRLPSCR